MDEAVFDLIRKEETRQAETLMMIPSENYVSPAVRKALGSVLTNKYSEGYPGKRYYQGNAVVDEIERLAQERAQKLFNVPHANVQPYSGSPANLAILAAILSIGDPILSQHLSMGGHLSMGQAASMTAKYYRANYYGLTGGGDINWEELEEKASLCRPKIIFCGGTAFTKIFNFCRYAEITDKVGAYLVADISHIAGLVAGGAHPSPAAHAHIIMTTTHKTLRGPRGAMIMVTEKGLAKDPELCEKIDKAVFPGLQGGPHENSIAALAVALAEADTSFFKQYSHQIVKNSSCLAGELIKHGFNLIGGGSENHMVWIDLTNKGLDGWTAAWGLEAAGIIVNRQSVPFDLRPPYYPSGLRLGTPAITTRGMGEREMVKIADWINETIEFTRGLSLFDIGSPDKSRDQAARKNFKKEILRQDKLLKIKKEVKTLLSTFPVP